MRIVCALIVLCLLVGVSRAQPAEVTRELHNFDFEERRLGNVEDLPMNWEKVEGEGLPHYVNARISGDLAHTGTYSFRFDLNGGSLIYRYPAGRIKVQPGAHYHIGCSVFTTVLPHARARLTGYFADIDGNPIAETSRHSRLWSASAENAGWEKLMVELTADDPRCAYLVIELGLVQPAAYAESTLGERKLFEQDIRGTAWFDDVSVAQVPQVTMFTARPGNIFHRSDPLLLEVIVNDRFTDDLSAQLIVRDAHERVIHQVSGGAVSIAGAQQLGPGKKKMTLRLPQVPPGWYQAAMVMSSQGQFVGQQTLDFVQLADDVERLAPDPRFGIDAAHLPFDAWEGLAQILPTLGAGRVKLAVWNATGDVQQGNALLFDQLVERLQELRIIPTACLVDLPPEIAKNVGGSSLANLLNADRTLWQPHLAFLISRHASHLDKWQLGSDGSDAFVTDPAMRQVYRKFYSEFAELVQSPDLAMPWPAWYELDGELPATVALAVSPDVLPQQLPLYTQEVLSHPGHNLSIWLQPLDREKYGRELQIRDFAQRFAYALAGGANRVDVRFPFVPKRNGDTMGNQPTEMLIITRTLMAMLGGASYKGKVPISDGVEAMLFDRDGDSVMLVWDRGSQGGVKELPVNLGAQARKVDLWGNVSPVINTAVASANDGPQPGVAIQITPMPFFLVNIDGPLAQMRASVAFDNPMIESSFKEHQRKIRFTNPYKQAIAGSVKLKAPPGWTINPPMFQFSLNPGETFEKDLTVNFPFNTYAGPKTVDAKFTLQNARDDSFSVPLTLKIGLSDIGLQTIALRDGNDVIVQQMITNYSDKPVNYDAFAIFPGQARQERLVTNLGAGRTTIKKYRFKDVPITPEGRIRSGLRESQGTRVLNDEVQIQ